MLQAMVRMQLVGGSRPAMGCRTETDLWVLNGDFLRDIKRTSFGDIWGIEIWGWVNTYENTIFSGMNIHFNPAILM